MTASALLPLMTWLSPAFPVGSFAYSHGLEWAQHAGLVTDADSLRDWLDDLIAHGSARNDAILLAEAHRAATAADGARLTEVAELACALANSAERRLEATTQGEAFRALCADVWPCAALALLGAVRADRLAYPVALGAVAASHAVPLRDALEGFGLGFASTLVSASVRLGVVGPTGGQRVIRALLPALRDLARFAADATLDDLGGVAFRSDLASLQHETQYSRLFRS